MEIDKIDYSYLSVKELKVVCKFFKVDIPPRAKRDQVEALVVLAQTGVAMATVEAYQHFMASLGTEGEIEDDDVLSELSVEILPS